MYFSSDKSVKSKFSQIQSHIAIMYTAGYLVIARVKINVDITDDSVTMYYACT